MPSKQDEYRYWTAQLTDASHNMLQTVQASAGKWQAAIAALLAAYATVGFLLTPDKLAALPVHGAAEIILLVTYGLAGLLGIVAVILANLAAQGIPQIKLRKITSGTEYRKRVTMRRLPQAAISGWPWCSLVAQGSWRLRARLIP